MSFIQPMFHLKPNPRPPFATSRVTPGQDVDSSATIMMPGLRRYEWELTAFSSSTASRFSLPPYLFGTHWPSLRE